MSDETKYRAVVTLERSLAMYEGGEIDATAPATTTFEIDLPDGSWIQFTYGMMRGHDGGWPDLTFDGVSGRWFGPDGLPASDVVIAIKETA